MFRQILAGSRYLIIIAVIGSFLASITVLVYERAQMTPRGSEDAAWSPNYMPDQSGTVYTN